MTPKKYSLFPISLLYLFLPLFLYAATTHAAIIEVNPILIKIAEGQKVGSVTIKNNSQNPVALQLHTLLWTRINGQDIYQPTRDLLVTPPVLVIPPTTTQLIRLGLRQPTVSDIEQTYRLYIHEIPPKRLKNDTSVRMVLNVNIPVLIAPHHGKEQCTWLAQIDHKANTLQLTAVNNGNMSIKLGNATITTANDIIHPQEINVRLFAGESRKWTLKLDKTFASLPGNTIKIKTLNDEDVPTEKVVGIK